MHKTTKIKLAQKILFFLVLTILVIHSVTPHNHDHHQDGESINLHQKHDSFLGVVKNCLNYDLGEGHLEHFLSANSTVDLNIQQNPPIAYLSLLYPSYRSVFQSSLNRINTKEIIFIQRRYHHNTNVLRGPPNLS